MGQSTSHVMGGSLPSNVSPAKVGSFASSRYTVMPISEDTVYSPAEGSTVDRRVAAFFNSRSYKILFTRIDDHDNYLYGRLIVKCDVVDDDFVDPSSGESVRVCIRHSDEWL